MGLSSVQKIIDIIFQRINMATYIRLDNSSSSQDGEESGAIILLATFFTVFGIYDGFFSDNLTNWSEIDNITKYIYGYYHLVFQVIGSAFVNSFGIIYGFGEDLTVYHNLNILIGIMLIGLYIYLLFSIFTRFIFILHIAYYILYVLPAFIHIFINIILWIFA